MKEYNLLLLEGKFSGVIILQTPAYKGIINNRPHLRHENLGNFYSEVSCQDLAARTDEILGAVKRERFFSTDDLAGDVVWNLLVEMAQSAFGEKRETVKSPFVLSLQNPDTDYIIRYNQGVGLYCSRTYQESVDPAFSNAALAMFLLHGLSNDKDGSAMKAFDSFVDNIRVDVIEARTYFTDLTKLIRYGNEDKTESEDEEGFMYLAIYEEVMEKITKIAEEITESAIRISEKFQ